MTTILGGVLATAPALFMLALVVTHLLVWVFPDPEPTVRRRRELGWCLREYREREAR